MITLEDATLYCKWCQCVILKTKNATFVETQLNLPLMEMKVDETNRVWSVHDYFLFENIGFSKSVEGIQYLICADCEKGPIGCCKENKICFISESRVLYKQ